MHLRHLASHTASRHLVLSVTLFVAMASCSVATVREPTGWYLVGPIQGASFEIDVVAHTACADFAGIEVTESPDTVQVVAYAAYPAGDVGCHSSEQHLGERTVTLAEPIGDRTLLGCRPQRPQEICPSADE